jgi:hypothetical protein
VDEAFDRGGRAMTDAVEKVTKLIRLGEGDTEEARTAAHQAVKLIAAREMIVTTKERVEKAFAIVTKRVRESQPVIYQDRVVFRDRIVEREPLPKIEPAPIVDRWQSFVSGFILALILARWL